jgi:fatty-acyl-CoA synthase
MRGVAQSDRGDGGDVQSPGPALDQPLTLLHIRQRALRTNTGREVVSCDEGAVPRLTYAAIAQRVDRLAGALRELGISAGDRVGTLAWNSHRHLELMLAVPCSGAVLHTANPRLEAETLLDQIREADDRVLFVDAAARPLVEALAPRLETVEHIVLMGTSDLPPGRLEYEALLAGAQARVAYPDIDERQPAVVAYTSGTTGAAKAVVYTHRSIVLQALVQLGADAAGISQRDRVLPVAPIFHVNGWGLPYAAALAGAGLVLPGRHVGAERLVDIIRREQVTVAAGVPTIWHDVLGYVRSSGAGLGSLRSIVTGGAPVPQPLMKGFELDHDVAVVQTWGMTETLACSAYAHPPVEPDDPEYWRFRQAAGRPVPLMEARLVDDDGHELPWDGESTGHLEVRGPLVSGYTSEQNGPTSSNGWLRTHDLASIDDRGYVRIVDRVTDLIKSGGEWIPSAELDALLNAHEGVEAAAVVRRVDERWTERPCAFVVRTARGSCTEAELHAYLATRVPKWWLPDDYVFVEDLPRTSVGKIDKRALRAQADALNRTPSGESGV